VLALLALLVVTHAGCSGSEPPAVEDILVEVSMVALDSHRSPVLILHDERGDRHLPIWIGAAEAQSITLEIEKYEARRPNAHDLANRVIQGLDGEIIRVVVTELRAGTYYAALFLRTNGQTVEVDSRPSDAIAIALRAGAPIFVRAPLFDEATDVLEHEPAGQQI
jgi:bifunctional DNase/RNase